MSQPKRIFLDANVLVAIGFKPGGDYSQIFEWRDFQFVTSEHILREVDENLRDLERDPTDYIVSLRERMEVTDQVVKLPAGLPLRDGEDRQALAEAIGAECDEFITFNNRDFGSLYGQQVYGVYVRHSAEFIRLNAKKRPS